MRTYRYSVTTYLSIASGDLLDFTMTIIEPQGIRNHNHIGTKNGLTVVSHNLCT
jgi:hypothetical protein